MSEALVGSGGEDGLVDEGFSLADEEASGSLLDPKLVLGSTDSGTNVSELSYFMKTPCCFGLSSFHFKWLYSTSYLL